MNKYLNMALIVLISLASLYLFLDVFPRITSILKFVYSVLIPFIVSVLLTFILVPIVNKIERRNVHRGVAVFIVFSITIYVIVYGIVTLSPMVAAQLQEINQNIPRLVEELDNMLKKMSFGNNSISTESIANYVVNNVIAVNQLVKDFMSILYESLGIVFLTPIITFYLLFDYNNIKRKLRLYLHKRRIDIISDFIDDLELFIGVYFRGLIFVTIILIIVASTVFSLIGLKYPVVFGVVVGITNIIPIIGPYIGGAFAAIFALTQSTSLFFTVIAITAVLQLLESNFLTPYIQSRMLKIHPLIILIAFIVFGSVFGFIGMVLSIPLLGLVILIIKYSKISYKRRSFISVKRP